MQGGEEGFQCGECKRCSRESSVGSVAHAQDHNKNSWISFLSTGIKILWKENGSRNSVLDPGLAVCGIGCAWLSSRDWEGAEDGFGCDLTESRDGLERAALESKRLRRLGIGKSQWKWMEVGLDV